MQHQRHAGVQAYSCTSYSRKTMLHLLCIYLTEIYLLRGWDQDWNLVLLWKHLLSLKCKGTTYYSQANHKIRFPQIATAMISHKPSDSKTQCPQGKALVGEAKMFKSFRKLEARLKRLKPKQKESPSQANSQFSGGFPWFCNGSRIAVETQLQPQNKLMKTF